MQNFVGKLWVLIAPLLAFASLPVDIIVCTYNRPLQLKAWLDSLDRFVTGYGQVQIIARIDTDFEKGYTRLIQQFPQHIFLIQSKHNPHLDFKPIMLGALQNCPSKYVMFAMDDIVITDDINLTECTEALEKTGAHGFYLRLGKNITYCHSLHIATPSPPLVSIGNGIYLWHFSQGLGDWNYPNSMDMTILRTAQVAHDLEGIDFRSPNTLEGWWGYKTGASQLGLCFEYSKIVNILFNVVQKDWPYPVTSGTDVYLFNEKFNDGFELDTTPLYKIRNKAPHVTDYIPTFSIPSESP